MRYWGTENNVSRPGKAGRASRRPQRDSRGDKRARSSPRAVRGGTTRRTVASSGSVKHYPFLRQFYRGQTQLSDRLLKTLFALVVAALIYVFVLGDSGAIKIVQLRMRRSSLETNIDNLQRNTKYLEQTIALLKDDLTYIEKIGRERYGYVRPGDRVYKIVPSENR